MPRYRANVKLLLAHESRTVEAGDEFTTTFPKVLVKGELVDMKLGENITLLTETEEPADDAADGEAAPAKAPAKRTPTPKD